MKEKTCLFVRKIFMLVSISFFSFFSKCSLDMCFFIAVVVSIVKCCLENRNYINNMV